MYILDDGIRLNASLERPANGGEKSPLVIIIHGFTGHMEERHILAVAQALRGVGFATLRVDMYGHGKSDGQFRNHTLYKWLNNAMAVIDYARKLDFVTDLYLCGHSQGGLTVMLAAALKRDIVKGLIPLSPAAMIPQGARDGILLGTPFDPESPPEVLHSWDGRDLDSNYVRVAQTIHVEEAIARYKGPVLLIHGDADEAVPLQCSLDAAKGYADAKLVVIPGDTHCYDHHLEMVVKAVAEWMEKKV